MRFFIFAYKQIKIIWYHVRPPFVCIFVPFNHKTNLEQVYENDLSGRKDPAVLISSQNTPYPIWLQVPLVFTSQAHR